MASFGLMVAIYMVNLPSVISNWLPDVMPPIIAPKYQYSIKGQFKCNGAPMNGLDVKVYEEDPVEDDFLGSDRTGSDGRFALSGEDYEVPTPGDSVKFYVWVVHGCVPKTPGNTGCPAEFKYTIPWQYYNGKLFDLGTVELWNNKVNKYDCR
ncbi:unnamed protein product, partial [Mesorhabditis spiculigera]